MMNTSAAALMPSLDTIRLDAVLARDRAFDGRFVYAVTSTGVYCRPSCPSRRPRPDRVRFFALSEDAEYAGFRPCRRCRPDTIDPQAQRIAEACAYIRTHADERLTLEALSRRSGMSAQHFQRTFTRRVGVSPREYADACRMRRLRRQLRSGDTVTSAMHDAGFGSSSRLYERAHGALGMTPATYRKGGAGAIIRYTIGASPFGRVLVAATTRGVAAVKIADTDSTLETALRDEFHAASIVRDDRSLKSTLDGILATTDAPSADIPLDILATAFQWRVWCALREIPPGTTQSYQQIARAIGRPAAVRAVARACATNPVALVIPCHRVVPAAGGTGGYRWGSEAKRKLLAEETKMSAAQPHSSDAAARSESR
jgi:AraC family transcriptional regulator of adaptative response/methylated-DNA-[protein]-cysteine methyltransferase